MMDRQTLIRAIEGFIVAVVILFGATITIGGQPLDLSTPAGRTAAVSAVLLGIADAVRRVLGMRGALPG